MEIRRAQDQRGTARDRVVEQLCFRLGHAGSPLRLFSRLLKTAACQLQIRNYQPPSEPHLGVGGWKLDIDTFSLQKAAVCTIAHRRESSAETGVAPSQRSREADLLEQRFEIISRSRNAGEDPSPGLPDP